jgi:hypothetical protein
MCRSIATTTAVAVLLMAGSAGAQYYPPSPKQDYDASLYTSPGGIGRARPSEPRAPTRVYGYRAPDTSVPYSRSCGQHRHWNGERCVIGPRK